MARRKSKKKKRGLSPRRMRQLAAAMSGAGGMPMPPGGALPGLGAS